MSAVPLLVLFRLVAMARFNRFHRYWRYTGISHALDIVKAVGMGSLGFLVANVGFLVGSDSRSTSSR